MTLEEFIESDLRNSHIKFRGIQSYYRKGPVAIDGEIKNVITRANTTNPKRWGNIASKEIPTRTGLYKALDDHTVDLAIKHGFDGVYVESVMNQFLHDVLIRYGYRQVNEHLGTDNYYKDVT